MFGNMFKLHNDSPWIYLGEIQFGNIAWRLKNQKRYFTNVTASDCILVWGVQARPQAAWIGGVTHFPPTPVWAC
jgi:hypothetical protein